MSHSVYLGIGSNIEPRKHLELGLDELAGAFRLDAVSGVYQSAAVGFDGAPFLNCVAAIDTAVSLPMLAMELRAIEFRYGRSASSSKFSSRSLDIDILTYDALDGDYWGVRLPRDEIITNAYVLCPFAEVAGELCIPGQQKTLAELWSAYDRSCQPLRRVGFVWRRQSLPIGATNNHNRRKLLIS